MSKITDNLIKEGKIIYKYLKSNNLDEFNQVSYYLDHIPNDMDSNVKRILVINTNYNNNPLAFGNKLTKKCNLEHLDFDENIIDILYIHPRSSMDL